MLLFPIVQALMNPPDIKVLSHQDCMYGKALKILLDYSEAKYADLDVLKHMDMIKSNNHIPKLYLNGRLVGGYQDSLSNWIYIFKKLPEPPENLKDPEYVIAKYGHLSMNKNSSVYLSWHPPMHMCFLGVIGSVCGIFVVPLQLFCLLIFMESSR